MDVNIGNGGYDGGKRGGGGNEERESNIFREETECGSEIDSRFYSVTLYGIAFDLTLD